MDAFLKLSDEKMKKIVKWSPWRAQTALGFEDEEKVERAPLKKPKTVFSDDVERRQAPPPTIRLFGGAEKGVGSEVPRMEQADNEDKERIAAQLNLTPLQAQESPPSEHSLSPPGCLRHFVIFYNFNNVNNFEFY